MGDNIVDSEDHYSTRIESTRLDKLRVLNLKDKSFTEVFDILLDYAYRDKMGYEQKHSFEKKEE